MKSRILFSLFLLILASSSVVAQYRLYESGMKAYKAENWDSAIADLTDFLSKWQHDKAHDDEINYALGVCYFRKGEYQNAMKVLDEAMRDTPTTTTRKGSISWLLAVCCDRLNQSREAIVEYTNALKEYASNSKNRSRLFYERSLIYSKLGETESAKADLNEAITIDPGNQEAKTALNKMSETVLAANREAKTQIKPKKVEDKKAEDKKAEDKKAEDKRIEDKKIEDKRIEDKKAEDRKAEDKKLEEKKLGETTAKPVEPPAQQPAVQQPVQQPVQQVPTEVEKKIPTLGEMFADEKRYALVIGNSSYPPSMGLLPNPKNDASDVADLLKKQGFQVNLLIDATYGEMKKGIFDLKKALDQSVREKTVALFYYAGHGIQAMNENWLIPVDSKLSIKDEDDIRIQCVPVQSLVLNNLLYTNSRMNIIILDACRNNPIPSVSRSAGGKGLQEVSRARGSWIAFATAPGSVASDGKGRNGLYTQELLKAMSKPGLSIEEVFKEVRKNVYAQSGERQETWDNSNIIGDFYFNLNSKQ